MDKELQRYYEDRMSMLASDAWKDLIQDVENMLAATNTLDGVNNEQSLHFKKGEVSIMRWLISLKEISETAYQQLKD